MRNFKEKVYFALIILVLSIIMVGIAYLLNPPCETQPPVTETAQPDEENVVEYVANTLYQRTRKE